MNHLINNLSILCFFFRQYNFKDNKSRDAALKFNYKRGNGKCSGITVDESPIRVVRLSKLKKLTNRKNDEMICQNARKSIDIDIEKIDLSNCFYDATPPTAVYVRNSISLGERDGIEHAFLALSDRFGQMGSLEDVFELFGEFEPGKNNVMFSDDAIELTQVIMNFTDDDESVHEDIKCKP